MHMQAHIATIISEDAIQTNKKVEINEIFF